MAGYAADVGKSIVVDPSKFSDVYPAVWFSPATGEIVALKERSEFPPEEKYEVWIEPCDPEFRIGSGETNAAAKRIGFALVGQGREVFAKTKTCQATQWAEDLASLMKKSPEADHPVFYCRARKSACLIMITEIEAEKQVIRFRWRPLPTPAP